MLLIDGKVAYPPTITKQEHRYKRDFAWKVSTLITLGIIVLQDICKKVRCDQVQVMMPLNL
ncbi:hypothetical protein CEN45_16910 [Fischerella thermalis CCMEE 5198]|nr:hypothetical protein CEN45_16910 [Fischerella thermalis CCMEE 5198]